VVRCGACDMQLDETGNEPPAERVQCPSCGSTSRTVEQFLEATVTPRSSLTLKTPATAKWWMKQKVGDEFHRLMGSWHRRARVIDRRSGRYYEHIEDAETGEVVRHVEEPLSDHTDRGDARSHNTPPGDAAGFSAQWSRPSPCEPEGSTPAVAGLVRVHFGPSMRPRALVGICFSTIESLAGRTRIWRSKGTWRRRSIGY
jgi:hypothetical protein